MHPDTHLQRGIQATLSGFATFSAGITLRNGVLGTSREARQIIEQVGLWRNCATTSRCHENTKVGIRLDPFNPQRQTQPQDLGGLPQYSHFCRVLGVSLCLENCKGNILMSGFCHCADACTMVLLLVHSTTHTISLNLESDFTSELTGQHA